MKPTEFSIIHEDRTLTGRFEYLHLNEFGIRLVEPESELTLYSSHIPYFALGHHRYTDKDGSLTEFGIQQATVLLIKLYNLHLFVIKHVAVVNEIIDQLKEDFQVSKKLKEEFYQEFLTKRMKIKREMKEGIISSKDYALLLKPLKQEYEVAVENESAQIEIKIKNAISRNHKFSEAPDIKVFSLIFNKLNAGN